MKGRALGRWAGRRPLRVSKVSAREFSLNRVPGFAFLFSFKGTFCTFLLLNTTIQYKE